MPDFPDTRLSLLHRLQNGHDDAAWSEFHEIYRPVLFRMVAAVGLPPQDHHDAVQEVWMAIYRGIDKYESRPHAFAFRGWLSTIARNTTINYLTRRRATSRIGNISEASQLEDSRFSVAQMQSQWDREYQRQVLEWAAKRVASRIAPNTFDAFWRTVVNGESVEAVAADLGMSPGAVYVARGRIMASLKREVDARELKEEQ